jgi:hypothetical protein
MRSGVMIDASDISIAQATLGLEKWVVHLVGRGANQNPAREFTDLELRE